MVITKKVVEVWKQCDSCIFRVDELDKDFKNLTSSHEALHMSCGLKLDNIELHEKYENLEISYQAIDLIYLVSSSSTTPSSSTSYASTIYDELTLSCESSSLESLF